MPLDYRSMLRASTAAVMTDERAFFDAALASDGSDAIIDYPVTDPDTLEVGPLVVSVYRGRPRINLATKGDGTPGGQNQQPDRTQDIFAGPASLMTHGDRLRGRTLKFQGNTYTIMFAKPHTIANVTIYTELHCDINQGMFQPAGRPGIL